MFGRSTTISLLVPMENHCFFLSVRPEFELLTKPAKSVLSRLFGPKKNNKKRVFVICSANAFRRKCVSFFIVWLSNFLRSEFSPSSVGRSYRNDFDSSEHSFGYASCEFWNFFRFPSIRTNGKRAFSTIILGLGTIPRISRETNSPDVHNLSTPFVGVGEKKNRSRWILVIVFRRVFSPPCYTHDGGQNAVRDLHSR